MSLINEIHKQTIATKVEVPDIPDWYQRDYYETAGFDPSAEHSAAVKEQHYQDAVFSWKAQYTLSSAKSIVECCAQLEREEQTTSVKPLNEPMVAFAHA